MTNIDEQDRLIGLLAPRHRIPEAVQDPAGPAAAELRRLIMQAPAAPRARPARTASRLAAWFVPRRLAFAVPAATVTAGLVAVVALAVPSDPAPPSGRIGAASPGTVRPVGNALRIVPSKDYIDITIIDPAADAERYNAELAEHGLDIEIALAPAGPDRVGRVVFMETEDTGIGPALEVVEAPGDCTANGNCSIGVRVPVDFSSYARIVFGRTALPGEDPDAG